MEAPPQHHPLDRARGEQYCRHRSSESFGIWTSTLTDRSGRAAIIDRLAFNGTIIDTGSDSHLSGPGRPTRSISARLAVLLLRVRAPQARQGRCRSRPTVSSRGRLVRSHFADGAPTLEPTDINRAANWKHARPPDSSRARLLPAAMRTAAERLRWLWPVLRRADRGNSAGAAIDAGLSPTPSCPPSVVRRGEGVGPGFGDVEVVERSHQTPQLAHRLWRKSVHRRFQNAPLVCCAERVAQRQPQPPERAQLGRWAVRDHCCKAWAIAPGQNRSCSRRETAPASLPEPRGNPGAGVSCACRLG